MGTGFTRGRDQERTRVKVTKSTELLTSLIVLWFVFLLQSSDLTLVNIFLTPASAFPTRIQIRFDSPADKHPSSAPNTSLQHPGTSFFETQCICFPFVSCARSQHRTPSLRHFYVSNAFKRQLFQRNSQLSDFCIQVSHFTGGFQMKQSKQYFHRLVVKRGRQRGHLT